MRNAMWVGGGITGMGKIPMLGVKEKGLTALIRKIFYSGAQGFAYDPNDLTEEKVNWRKNQLLNTEDFTYGSGANYTAVKEADGWALTAIAQTGTGYSLLGIQYPIGAASDSRGAGTVVRSIEVKKGTGVFRFGALSGLTSLFVNAATMTAIDPPSGLPYTITAIGSDWYRIETFYYMSHLSSSALSNLFGWSTAKATSATLDTTSQVGAVIRVRNPSFAFVPYETTKSIPYQAISDFNSDFIRQFPLHTLYQDAAGTVPVTAAGQPVGLMLDKSKGLVLGPELVAGGSSILASSWQVSAGTPTIKNGLITFNAAGVVSNIGNQSSVIGRTYEIKITVSLVESGGVRVIFGGAATAYKMAAGTYTEYVFATASTGVSVQANTGTGRSITSVSVKELSGNHAYQTTSASRPILRKNAETGANYLEFDGSDDFLQTSNIDFTATDKVSLFAGLTVPLGANTGCVIELGTNATVNNGSFGLFKGPSTIQWASKGTSGVLGAQYGIPVYPDVLCTKAAINSSLLTVRRNAILSIDDKRTQGTGNYGSYPLYIGRRGGTSLPLKGHVYGLIGVGKLVSDNETTAIEKELAKRVGVTLNV